MNRISYLFALAASLGLGSPTAFGYVQEVGNLTPDTLEVTFGYAGWGTRTGMRIKPGDMGTIDTGEMWPGYVFAGGLCLNEIRVRKVDPSEGDKPSIAVKDASGKEFPPGLESGFKAFREAHITWIEDSTLKKMEEGFQKAVGAVNLAKILGSAVKGVGTAVAQIPGKGTAIGAVINAVGEALQEINPTDLLRAFDVLKVTGCKNRKFDVFKAPDPKEEKDPEKAAALAKLRQEKGDYLFISIAK